MSLSYSRSLVALASVALLGACPASSDEVRPPDDEFFFPTGIDIDEDETALFVINANSDLRYDSGSLSLVDLELVEGILASWLGEGEAPSGRDCEVSRSNPFTLICDESEVIRTEGGVRIGNFATEVDVQTLADGSSRLFLAVRGDPSLSWIDYDKGAKELSCGGSGEVPRCGEEHRLRSLFGDDSVGRVPSEPFGVYVDSVGGFAMMTHLSQAAVSLASAPLDGSAPLLTDAIGGVFEANPNTGVRSALGIAARVPGGRVYVTSRSENRVQVFNVVQVGDSEPSIIPADFFFLRGVQPSDDGRGIRFSADGNQAYILNRSPASLQIIDTSLDTAGLPRNEIDSVVEVCSNSANLVVGDLGAGERVFISCFRDGQVWSVNPRSGALEAIVDVGRGPQSLALSTTRQALFVTNFLEDTVSVVDLRPGASTENRVVLKLGRQRQLEESE